jgi:hypothetical protein
MLDLGAVKSSFRSMETASNRRELKTGSKLSLQKTPIESPEARDSIWLCREEEKTVYHHKTSDGKLENEQLWYE